MTVCNCDVTFDFDFDRTDPAVKYAVCRKCGARWAVGRPVMCAPAPRLRILCDVDGVLTDFVGLILDYVRNNTGLTPAREAIDQWDCFAALGMREHWPYFRAQCDGLGLCRSMRPMFGAAVFYAELRALGDTRVCTSPMTPAWLTQRAEWLEAFGVPLGEQIHCHDKSLLAGPGVVLIDDRVENCVAFVKAGGRAFCIEAAYNLHCPWSVPRGTHAECLAWLRWTGAAEAVRP